MNKQDKKICVDDVLAILEKVTDKLMIEDAADGFDSGYNNGICAVYDRFKEAIISMSEKKIDK